MTTAREIMTADVTCIGEKENLADAVLAGFGQSNWGVAFGQHGFEKLVRCLNKNARAIAGQISIGSIGADDEFDIIIEHRRAATGETETGQLLYAGLDRSRGKDLQLMQWDQGGRSQWFEAVPPRHRLVGIGSRAFL